MTQIKQQPITIEGIKFFDEQDGAQLARAYLIMPCNSLHPEPFGFMEDVFVQKPWRGQGLGTEMAEKVIETARERCYKLICTSRHEKPRVHQLYESLGFYNHGIEFRMDFDRKPFNGQMLTSGNTVVL